MLTRCPSCATHFRVTPEQLKARSGRVRCGECQNVFNALDSLIEEPVVVTLPAAAVAVPPTPTFWQMPPPGQHDGATSVSGNEAERGTDPANPADGIAVPSAPALHDPSGIAEPVPEALEELPGLPPAPRRWPWVIGSMVALIVLLLQAVLAYRVELAVLWPESKPAWSPCASSPVAKSACRRRSGWSASKPPTSTPTANTKGRLILAATLKNRAPFAQQFPHLELTLTDTADQAIARKVLAPADYLPPATAVAGGMKPNADIMIALGIDSGGMAASGYRLYLFYP
jgi:predicted Zn finger-like uncharacterized protein